MGNFIQLNLRSDSEKGAADNSPNTSQRDTGPSPLGSKRLNKMLKKAAHKASAEYGRSGKSGIFSK
ncbi:MAG: hypothetical protein JST28_00520 [Acidobacteria bacterium]|nr:hypothetical protein [Acidobacteriota bacterium]